MLRHSTENTLVYDIARAKNGNFFNGAYNTMQLEFDPLISGYAFFKWMKIPKWVEDAYPGFRAMTEKNFLEGFSISDIELETSNMTWGFSQNEYNVATNSKKGNTDFSIKHHEFSGSPIRNAYQYWITGIRDPETGFATYPRLSGLPYGAKNHTGEIIYINTRPDANNVDANNIEFACYYTAVFPTKINLGHFNFSHGSHDLAQYEQSFKGCFHISNKVDELAKQILRDQVYGLRELGEFDPNDLGGETSNNNGTFVMADAEFNDGVAVTGAASNEEDFTYGKSERIGVDDSTIS